MIQESVAVHLLRASLGSYALGAAGALLFARFSKVSAGVGFVAAQIGSLAGCLASLAALTLKTFPSLVLLPQSTTLLSFSVHFDSLAAFFTLVISVLGLAISIYSSGYVIRYHSIGKVGILAGFFNLLLLVTTLIFSADNAVFFLIAWELMALCAFVLVVFDHELAETRRAGVLFFVMSHIGAGCLILGFLLLFQVSGSFRFEDLRGIGTQLSLLQRTAVFALFFLGFGIKAGVIPLHVWLPAAHPVAPSNISAFLSGVLIKTGIYGMVRVFFGFLDPPPLSWGLLILVVGSVSAVLGVLYALVEHDLKRLLAFHSIENIGIILVGLGASLLFLSFHQPALAALGLVAGLYHTLNHACFKGLLFLGAGAVLQATGTRNMEELGGLIRRLPWTTFFFLLGAVAISGLPPLNGFVSEWLTYQTLLQGFGVTPGAVRLIFPVGGALLALTGALAAACFVKAVGIAFLSLPRSPQAEAAQEVPRSMLLGMATLGVACVALGVLPMFLVSLLDSVTMELLGQSVTAGLIAPDGWVLTPLGMGRGAISTAGMAALFVALLPMPLGLWLVFSRRTPHRVDETWDCGLDRLTPQMEYTATAYSKPLRMIFQAIYRPRRRIQADFAVSHYFTRAIHFESHIEPTFEQLIYRPVNRAVLRFSRRVRMIQTGSLTTYLIYIFLTLIALLVWEKVQYGTIDFGEVFRWF
ncbi:MAG: hydrogenase 4 subunit B [Acidobacteriota bacterium]